MKARTNITLLVGLALVSALGCGDSTGESGDGTM